MRAMKHDVGSASILLARPIFGALAGAAPAAIEALSAQSGITPGMIADNEARIPPAQLASAWSALVQISGDPQIALRIAAATPAGAFGTVEYICRSAPTLGAALKQWSRYLSILNSSVLVGLVDERELIHVRVFEERAPCATPMHELCFAILGAEARRLSAGAARPISVDFTHRAPADVAAYVRWFDAPVHFGRPINQISFSKSAMETQLITADANLSALLRNYADSLPLNDQLGPMTAQVRRLLVAGLRDDAAGVDEIAQKLALSPRSLQRRLKEEGASFQSVRDEVSREMAGRYLEDKSLTISEISFMLGFSEPSAFFRAFKRWTGLTPHESRARLHAAG
jgi:AraC-like DNA-binding protein